MEKSKRTFRGSYPAYALTYFFFYWSLGVFTSVLSMYLTGIGKSKAEMSFIMSASSLFGVVLIPIVGYINDKLRKPRLICTVMMACVAVFGILFALVRETMLLFLLNGCIMGFISSLSPVSERMATSTKYRYGTIRIWGTFGYAAAVQVACAMMEFTSPQLIFVSVSVSAVLAIVGFLGTDDISFTDTEAAKAAAAVTKKAPVNAEEPSEEIPLVTAQIPTVSESMISDINSIMNDDNNKEEGDEAVAQQEAAAGVEPEETVPFTRQNRQPESMEEYNTDNDEVEEEKDKKLTGELAKIFRKYRDMPGLEEQLVDLFDTIDDEMQINTSKVGNILISGNSSSDKTDLARTIIRAINTLYPDKQKKIAKTSGESINQRGIAKAMGRLKGTALIVEGAGTIQPKRINELLNCLEQDTDRMIVIFEDSDTDMNVLINFNPELTNTFNHRIILKQYTVNELVEMAKRFARKRQYEVDDDALLELYLKIDQLHNVNDNIKLDDIKEIINQAIVNSERRASRRFFGGLKKKRSENGDVIFLTEADFKDR